MAESKAVESGRKAPAFTLPNQDGDRVRLADFEGKWVVLYFYPKDDTSGCTTEACDFTNNLRQFDNLNAVVLGVSPDSVESHQRFMKKHNLKITLLSDPERKVFEKYGVFGEKKLYGKMTVGVIRSTFLIDPCGKVAHAWLNVKATGHAEKVAARLAEVAAQAVGSRSGSETCRPEKSDQVDAKAITSPYPRPSPSDNSESCACNAEGFDAVTTNHNRTGGDNEAYAFDLKEVFDPANYLHFYERTLNSEITARQVDFLVEQLKLAPPMRILDLACGQGRHANALAERGLSVEGVDINEHLIELARSDAANRKLDVRYCLSDMRSIRYEGEFDRVLLLYTAFGYFSDTENCTVLRNIAAALKPGGLLCMDIPNRDMFLRYFLPSNVTEKGEDLMININSFDARAGRWNCRRIIIRDNKRTDVRFSIRLYNFTELRHLMNGVGLAIKAVSGSWDSESFASTSHQMIIIAEKSESPS